MAQYINQIAAHELELYINTSSEKVYNQSQLILQSLAKKMNKGVFDFTKSVKLWSYLADYAAKEYVRGSNDKWNIIFNKPTRMFVAKQLAIEAHRYLVG